MTWYLGGSGIEARTLLHTSISSTPEYLCWSLPISTIILFLPFGTRKEMSELNNFDNFFRLDGKVALVTGGKHAF
jgi:hypothetical protein